MKILSAILQNFGSYKELDFDFQNQGLTLIQGPTGSGKSTLMDAIPWILFGRTAKGGAADEVCNWTNKEPTEGTLYMDEIRITRIRGNNKNDLWFDEINGNMFQRGKDLKDTQRLIDTLLGVNYDTYLSGAYFHEFSQTAQFFSTTAKNRRQLCEQIVDLSLPKTLQEKLSINKKDLNNQLDATSRQISTYQTEIRQLQQLQISENTKAKTWQDRWTATRDYVTKQHHAFEKNRTKIISNECDRCGTVLEHPHEYTDTSENPHSERLIALNKETNPHQGNVKDFTSDINIKLEELVHIKQYERMQLIDIQDLETLESATEAFRSTLISNTVSYIQDTTNALLTKHFDAEIQVSFTATDADKLEVSIQKDGNEASFTQLSKGQRQILKLCFGVAVMKGVSNHKGVNFSQLFFDEALSGLDDTMKTKAFGLFEELSLNHESVFVIEHSEGFKAMFNNSYKVELQNGESKICQH